VPSGRHPGEGSVERLLPRGGGLTGRILLNKGCLLAGGPAGQASSDYRHGLFAVPAAAAPHWLQDYATERRQAPYGCGSGVRRDALKLKGQL
jgi:hypothetical protein